MTAEELKALIEGIAAGNSAAERDFAASSPTEMEEAAFRRGYAAACGELLAHVSARESEEADAALSRLKTRIRKMRLRNAQMLDGGAIDAGSFEGYAAACEEFLKAIRREMKK